MWLLFTHSLTAATSEQYFIYRRKQILLYYSHFLISYMNVDKVMLVLVEFLLNFTTIEFRKILIICPGI